MPGQSRTVFDSGSVVPGHPGQVQEHGEPGGAFDQGADCGATQPEDEITFPVPWDRSVFGLCWSFSDHDLRCDEALSASPGAGPRDPQCSPGPQACGELAAQRSAPLHVERLVDRLVRDPHRLIIGEIDPQAVSNLLRAPRSGPPAVLATPVTTPNPANVPASNSLPVRAGARPSEPVLHVSPQRIVPGQLGQLRAPATSIRMPLPSRGPILQVTAASRGVTAQLTRDRRR